MNKKHLGEVQTRLFETINEIENECQNKQGPKINDKVKHFNFQGQPTNYYETRLSSSSSDISDSESISCVHSSQKLPKVKVTQIHDDDEDDDDGDNDDEAVKLMNNQNLNLNKHMPRKSVISRQSIEMFLNTFPSTDGEYVDREILETVNDIIKSNIGINKNMNLMEKIKLILKSNKFHFIMIILVIFDIVCVLVQIVVDIIHKDFHNEIIHLFEEIAEIFSLCILSFFLLTILANIILLPKSFFKSKLELFDALIVIVSFSLEIVSIAKKDTIRAVELCIIVFRLIFLDF